MRTLGALLLVTASAIPALLPAQTIAELDVPTPNARPYSVAAGSDGAIWFTMPGAQSIGRIAADRTMTGFGTLTPPQLITAAPNGTFWFTGNGSNSIGVIDSTGAVSQITSSFTPRAIAAAGTSMWVTTSFGRLQQYNTASRTLTRTLSVPESDGPAVVLGAITVASDNAVWFADLRPGAPRLGRLTFQTEPGLPPDFLFVPLWSGAVPAALAAGDNGSVWFTDSSGSVGRATREGALTRINVPRAGNTPFGIARVSDGAIWFTENGANRLGRIDPTTLAITEVEIPTANGQPAGLVASGSALWLAEQGTNKIATTIAVSGPDVSVSLEPDKFFTGTGGPLGEAEHKALIRNVGTETARNVRMTVTVNGLYDLASSRQGCDTTVPGSPHPNPCTVGDLQPNETVEVDVNQLFVA